MSLSCLCLDIQLPVSLCYTILTIWPFFSLMFQGKVLETSTVFLVYPDHQPTLGLPEQGDPEKEVTWNAINYQIYKEC